MSRSSHSLLFMSCRVASLKRSSAVCSDTRAATVTVFLSLTSSDTLSLSSDLARPSRAQRVLSVTRNYSERCCFLVRQFHRRRYQGTGQTGAICKMPRRVFASRRYRAFSFVRRATSACNSCRVRSPVMDTPLVVWHTYRRSVRIHDVAGNAVRRGKKKAEQSRPKPALGPTARAGGSLRVLGREVVV